MIRFNAVPIARTALTPGRSLSSHERRAPCGPPECSALRIHDTPHEEQRAAGHIVDAEKEGPIDAKLGGGGCAHRSSHHDGSRGRGLSALFIHLDVRLMQYGRNEQLSVARHAREDAVVKQFEWQRIRALVDVTFSNSKIEAWWRSLKHQWLYLNQLNTITDVRRLTKFYVGQHNSVMPHAAFEGQTPDEMYYGTGTHLVDELKVKREEARRRRLDENRRAACAACPRGPSASERVAA